MSRDTLTGSRIRERRQFVALKQAELARTVGISASYLNLIEHNRRRIGGKLLVDIATALGVEPAMLSEGAEAALVATLREAAADAGPIAAETDRAEEFAGRFPGWAELLGAAYRRIASLERTVETLSDRLAHDPHLADSLHEVLSTAAAIHSTATILAEPGDIEPAWRDRFHRNLNEDSQRLAESSKSLLEFLDETAAQEERRVSPLEEVDAMLEELGYHIPALEEPGGDVAGVIAGSDRIVSSAGRRLAETVLNTYAEDALDMPLDEMTDALGEAGLDPVALSKKFAFPLNKVLRRLAALPADSVGTDLGLVLCDTSGTLLLRKSVAGFTVPRFGAPCSLWPVFAALNHPNLPIRRRVVQQGRDAAVFECLSLAYPVGSPSFDSDPLYHSIMLIVPDNVLPVPSTAQTAQGKVGSTCRVCPSTDCHARREPSILVLE